MINCCLVETPRERTKVGSHGVNVSDASEFVSK